jgi:hypothetical protein
VRVSFVAYGTEEHRRLEPQPGVMFCDFTPFSAWPKGDGSFIQAWVDAGCIVFDHHPTQRDVTMKFVEAGLGAYGENDRGECGAWLAYEHVWSPLQGGEFGAMKNTSIREFAEVAGVRDTWKKDDPRWQLACEQAEALMFWDFEDIVGGGVGSQMMLITGPKLFAKKLEAARTAISESHRFVTNRGTRVCMFQGVTPTSDAAELLEKDWDERERYGGAGHYQDGDGPTNIVAGFHYRVDAGRLQLQFSTRSHTGYDVGAFCKAHGGGGHSAAAGFTVDVDATLSANPYQVFRLLLEEYEAGQ